MEVVEGQRYWIAHVRGANFPRLRDKGFTTFYPSMDDYVFLAATDANRKLLNKQTELGVAFLKLRDQYQTITHTEMLRMFTVTVGRINPQTKILVVVGVGANLSGIVEEVSEDGQQLRVTLDGFRRTYNIWVDRMEVVEDKGDLTPTPKRGYIEEDAA